jgi:hypothetical protein
LCHFDKEGYEQIAQLIVPVVEQDHYGLAKTHVLTAPNLKRAGFTGSGGKEITLEFDQPMQWTDECKAWIELDGKPAPISAAMVKGNLITLQLSEPSTSKIIGYVSGKSWDGRPDKLLYGTNLIAALAFAGVPLESPAK